MKRVIVFIALLILGGCLQNNNNYETEKLKEEIWQTVLAHNKAWALDENMEEQMKHVHPDIVSVAPPFIEKISGIEDYRKGYKSWYDHAKVHSFKELNPLINIYNGTFAVVVFNIEMSFNYDEQLFDGWKGMDTMTLVKVNGKWLITSDMFARSDN